MITTLLFDLDDTMYPPSTGIMSQVRTRILDYIQSRLNLPADEADKLRRHYLQIYGTTMRGLQVNHAIDPDEYLHHVHDFALEPYLQPNTRLDTALRAIPQNKVIFTNASKEHARQVLSALGVSHHFSRIVDVRDMAYESKPQPAAYQRICKLLGVSPDACTLFEDSIRNLRPAKAMGMLTVLVQQDGIDPDGVADYVISRIEEVDQVMLRVGGGGQLK